MEQKLQRYGDMILAMRRGKSGVEKSAAKPILLLAIIECISENLLTENRIMWDDRNLLRCYDRISSKYSARFPAMRTPYFHLGSSPFYHLVWISQDLAYQGGHTPTIAYLEENLQYAKLDDEFWKLLQSREMRGYFKALIIERFLRCVQ